MKSKHLENNKFKKIKIKTIDHVILTFFFSYVCKLTKVINIAYLIELTLAYQPPPPPPCFGVEFRNLSVGKLNNILWYRPVDFYRKKKQIQI